MGVEMNEEYELILQCYRSGQMSEAQWQAHLSDDGFRAWHLLQAGVQPGALSAFISHTKRLYTGDPKNHKDWPAFKAGFEAALLGVPDKDFLNAVLDLCNNHAARPGDLTGDDAWIGDLWRSAEAILKAAPTPPADGQAQQDSALTAADYEEVLADHRRLVRDLDVLLNGEEGAAKKASLCDIVAQVRRTQTRMAQQDTEKVDAQPVAWESTTPTYIRYITEAKYQRLTQNTRAWYRPYRCSLCAQPDPAMAGDEISDNELRKLSMDHKVGGGWSQWQIDPISFGRALLKLVQPASGEDAKRIAWLSENDCMIERLVSTKGTRYRLSWGDTWQSDWYDTPGQAIDAAMQQGGQS